MSDEDDNLWNRPPSSSALTERLTCPAAFTNYAFLKLLTSCDLSRLRVEAHDIQRRLAAVFRGYSWPVYVAEVDACGDAFRLGLFRDPEFSSLAGHYGGEVVDLGADEWRLVFGEALEAGIANGVHIIDQDDEGRGWIVVSGSASAGRSPEEIRTLREGTMRRMTAAFGTRWPEGWLDRHSSEPAAEPLAVEPRPTLAAARRALDEVVDNVQRMPARRFGLEGIHCDACRKRFPLPAGSWELDDLASLDVCPACGGRALAVFAPPGSELCEDDRPLSVRATPFGGRGRERPQDVATAREFWKKFREAEAEAPSREPLAVPARRSAPLDPFREWAVRYLPPSPSELARAAETGAEVRRLQEELLRRSAPPRGPSGRARPGGPLRE